MNHMHMTPTLTHVRLHIHSRRPGQESEIERKIGRVTEAGTTLNGGDGGGDRSSLPPSDGGSYRARAHHHAATQRGRAVALRRCDVVLGVASGGVCYGV